MTDLYGRKVSLIVSGETQQVDLSAMHFKFSIRAADMQTPTVANIRIYNLSDSTSQAIQKEFIHVVLQAGYQDGEFGSIFEGNVIQFRRGRENETDTYLDIMAADGDEAYNFAVVNSSVAAGSVPIDQYQEALRSMSAFGVAKGYVPDNLPGPKLPRGKVLYGMARDVLRDLSKSTATSWSIQNNQLQMVPITSYLPGDAVVLTSKTGMIGLPEQQVDGIHVTCLINPRLRMGARIQIDNKSIQRATINAQYTAINFLPRVTDDGFYRVIVADFIGDTRGNEWYNRIISVSVDDTVTPALAARGYG